MLWIRFYSRGSMFEGCQNFPGSWGLNFVGSVMKIILINIKYMIVYTCTFGGDVNSWAMVTHKNHEHWSPKNNSTVQESSHQSI